MWLAIVALGLAIGHAAPSQALDVRPQDEVWLISTRHIACAADVTPPAVWQLSAGAWNASDEATFHSGDKEAAITVIYIHGNRIDDHEGASGGLAVYQSVVAQYGDETPVRFVIWSWPSTKLLGPIKDILSKAARSDDEAVLLARFLSTNEAENWRVGIVAFSFGARITGGAMHLLGGGELIGYTVPADRVPKFHVAFWAAAADNDWLLPFPGYRHHLAMPLGEKWLNLFNPCDESLFRYEMLTPKGGNPPALGFTGLAGRHLLPADLAERWEEWNVNSIVGRTHNYHPYAFSPWTAERTARVALWQESE